MYPGGYGEVLYVPKRLLGITICDWKGHWAVPPVHVMTIRSYDGTGGSTTCYIYIYIYI